MSPRIAISLFWVVLFAVLVLYVLIFAPPATPFQFILLASTSVPLVIEGRRLVSFIRENRKG